MFFYVIFRVELLIACNALKIFWISNFAQMVFRQLYRMRIMRKLVFDTISIMLILAQPVLTKITIIIHLFPNGSILYLTTWFIWISFVQSEFLILFCLFKAAAHIHRFRGLDETVIRMSADTNEGISFLNVWI